MYRLGFVVVLVYWLAAHQSAAQQSDPLGSAVGETPAGQAASQEKLSDAERITRLRRTIEESETRLGELREIHENPAGEYFKADPTMVRLICAIGGVLTGVIPFLVAYLCALRVLCGFKKNKHTYSTKTLWFQKNIRAYLLYSISIFLS